MLEADETHIKDITHLLKMDPVLVASILKECNKAEYSSPTTNLTKAIQILGMDEVLKIIVRKCVHDTINKSPNPLTKEILKHSLLTAYLMENMARCMKTSLGQAFVTGILHCISLIYIDENHWYKFIIKDTNSKYIDENFLSYPVDTANLLKDWNFPKQIIQSVKNHQRPNDQDEVLTHMLSIASLISWNNSFNLIDTPSIPEMKSCHNLGITPVDCHNFYRSSVQQLDEYLGQN
jgi:HD-like signal output (HDOD) protein